MIRAKDSFKLIGIVIVAACTVFVSMLFLNYQLDLVTIESLLQSPPAISLYEAQINMGKATIAITAGALVMTSIILLVFYIRNYIDEHSKELGVLKALGYGDRSLAMHFWVFGFSVLVGCLLGYALAYVYLPTFYEVQNAEHLFPEMAVGFHLQPILFCIVLPTLFFMGLSILFALRTLKQPALALLRDQKDTANKAHHRKDNALPFLKDLKRTTLFSKKMLVFFIAFSAFCFSAMMQMAISMRDLASEQMSLIMLTIGLILAFTTLFLSLSRVVKGNTKTIAMMRSFGYSHKECSRSILHTYRPIAYIGFLIGTLYQYALLKIILTLLFTDVLNMPQYQFDWNGFVITGFVFVIAYEVILYLYSLQIKNTSLKQIMLD